MIRMRLGSPHGAARQHSCSIAADEQHEAWVKQQLPSLKLLDPPFVLSCVPAASAAAQGACSQPDMMQLLGSVRDHQ